MATKTASTSISKLKGSANYQGWAIMAKAYLLESELEKAIESEDNNDNRLQEKALAKLILLCEYSTANHIQACTTGYQAWKVLKDLYNSDGFSSQYLLVQQYFQTTQSDFESTEAYVSKLKSIFDNLKAQKLEVLEIITVA